MKYYKSVNSWSSTRVELIRCCTDAEIPLLLSFASAKHDTLPSIRCGRFIPERNRACVYSWKVKVSKVAAGFHQEAKHITSSAAWFKGVINYQPGARALGWEVVFVGGLLAHSQLHGVPGEERKQYKNWEKKGKWGRVTIIWSEVAMETDPSSQPLESESHEWIEGDREHTEHTCWQCMHVCECVIGTCYILRKYTFY